MTVIFPGNYVAHLNAYRDQGVVALPGVEFYRLVGAVVVNPDNDNVTTVDGTLSAGTYTPQILSPDLRQDDKPRKDRPMTVPANAVVYRTAISAPGVQEAVVAGSGTIVIDTLGANAPTSATFTAEADGFFDEDGISSALNSVVDGTAISTSVETDVTVTTSVDYIAALNDDVSIPYAVEAGQGY